MLSARSTLNGLGALARAASTATLGRWDTPLLLAALLAVLAIRVDLLVSTDFPINDGALFYAFVLAIAQIFPALPEFVEFNGLSIPFAYPPLSFWLSAAAVQLGADPLAIVHRVPILMNAAWVLLFALLLRRTGHSRLFTAVAVLVFGTTFRSYEWLVMGGGLSRGMGSLFLLGMLLALLPTGLWTGTSWNWRRLLCGGGLLGATVLSHLEWGVLGTFGALACLALAQRQARPFLEGAGALGGAALVLALPWLAWALHAHGLAPFLAASRTGGQPFGLANGGGMLMRSATVLLPLAAFGAVLVLRTPSRFWLLLAAASVWLIPRSGETPLALATGVLTASGTLGLAVALRRAHLRGMASLGLAAFLVTVGSLAVLRAQEATRRPEHFATLAPEARSAMGWIATHLSGTRFAMLREAPWEYNAVAEWFPIFAKAINVTTLQGREWLPDREFDRTHASVRALDTSASCRLLMRSLQRLPAVDYLWTEGIDLQARASVLDQWGRGRSGAEWLEAWERRLRGDPPVHRVGSPAALRGGGTAAGCFDDAGWREVHANARVRIFQVPAAARVAPTPSVD